MHASLSESLEHVDVLVTAGYSEGSPRLNVTVLSVELRRLKGE